MTGRRIKKERNKKETRKKKGPLALASGPSLGRKRPRRAAIARGATAPQQYATALHKKQELLNYFRCKIHQHGWPEQNSECKIFTNFFRCLGPKNDLDRLLRRGAMVKLSNS
jgi:hypothetical protein